MIAVGALALTAAMPRILSSDIIKERIRAELSALSGLPVAIKGGIEVSLFPGLTATLADLQIGTPELSGQPWLTARSVDVELGWMAALTRQIEIQSLRVGQASISLSQSATGDWLPAALASPLAPTLQSARSAVSANPSEPDFSKLPNLRVGSLSITDSRLVVTRPDGTTDILSDFNAQTVWPGLAMPLRSSGSGVWRGKEVTYELDVRSPLLIVSGGNSEVTSSVKSEAIEFQFKGMANLADFLFTEGALTFETPSMAGLLSWIGATVDAGASVGRMSMRAELTTKDDHLRFNEALINFNGNPASGVLDLTRNGAIPALSGTLAFDQLDLGSFLAAFSIGANPATTRSGLNFLNQIDLDLRLSAKTANAGVIPLSEVAAAVRLKEGKADFDLGDAAVYGGRLQANLSISEAAGVPDGEMRVRVRGLDPLLLPILKDAPTISAPLDGHLVLKGKYVAFPSFMLSGAGKAEIDAGRGELRNLDLRSPAGKTGRGRAFQSPGHIPRQPRIDSLEDKGRDRQRCRNCHGGGA